jgi:hypothetical protein
MTRVSIGSTVALTPTCFKVHDRSWELGVQAAASEQGRGNMEQSCRDSSAP